MWGQYRAMKYRYEILDEAQYIKNASTQNSRAVKVIEARTRLAVTGTPMENHLGELWSIFDFLMPGFLFSYGKFHKDYELPILGGDGEALERLRLLAAPLYSAQGEGGCAAGAAAEGGAGDLCWP